MRVNYLGPLIKRRGASHPALRGYDVSYFPPSCFLVEVGDEAGIEGPIIEGDVLVVDEQRLAQHADLVLMESQGETRLYHSHRIGGRLRVMQTVGPHESFWASEADLRGVVVHQARRMAVV